MMLTRAAVPQTFGATYVYEYYTDMSLLSCLTEYQPKPKVNTENKKSTDDIAVTKAHNSSELGDINIDIIKHEKDNATMRNLNIRRLVVATNPVLPRSETTYIN
jgi:hypothetical protein